MKCSEIVPVVSSTKSVFPLRFLYLNGIALFLALKTSEAVTNASSFKKGEMLQNAEANLGKSTNQDGSNNSWTIRILYIVIAILAVLVLVFGILICLLLDCVSGIFNR